ncbi:MAG: hypothetical protein ABR564_02815, partial [Candidatus Dormibacteria bacterium]
MSGTHQLTSWLRRNRFTPLAPFGVGLAFLSMASAAYACGAISGTFTVTGDNGVAVTSTSVTDPADPLHYMQTITPGVAVSCGGDQASTL